MAPTDRNEVVWYYRLGEQTLGPVAWAEIEELTADTIDARDLLVARGGDQTWRAAAEALEEFPELAGAAPPVGAEDVGWMMEDDARPAAALKERPRPTVHAPRAIPAAGMAPEHGLGRWLSQGWEMVGGDLGTFILGMLLAGLISLVTVGICAPPMQAGVVLLALRRFRGEQVSAGTVLEGFQFFLPAWGFTLLVLLVTVVLTAPLSVLATLLTQRGGDVQQVLLLSRLSDVWSQIVGLAIAAAMFYTMALIVDRGAGVFEAISASWQKTSKEFLSYVGMALVLQIIAAAGLLACIVGVLVTAPLVVCAQIAAYMYHFRDQ